MTIKLIVNKESASLNPKNGDAIDNKLLFEANDLLWGHLLQFTKNGVGSWSDPSAGVESLILAGEQIGVTNLVLTDLNH